MSFHSWSWCLESSRVFSEHKCGHKCHPVDSLEYTGAPQSPSSLNVSFPSLLFLSLFGLSVLCPMWQQLNTFLPLNTFENCHPGSYLSYGEAQRQGNKGKSLSWSFGELLDMPKRITTIVYSKICIASSGTSNPHKECELSCSRLPLSWEVGDGNRVSSDATEWS